MREVQEDEPTTKAPEIDVSGVPEVIQELVRIIAAGALADGNDPSDTVEPARRVAANRDGTVVVKLRSEVTARGKDHDRIRLRPIKGRDYLDGTVSRLLDDRDFGPSIQFAAALAEPKGVIDEVEDIGDLNAIFFAVAVLRGNFFRLKKS